MTNVDQIIILIDKYIYTIKQNDNLKLSIVLVNEIINEIKNELDNNNDAENKVIFCIRLLSNIKINITEKTLFLLDSIIKFREDILKRTIDNPNKQIVILLLNLKMYLSKYSLDILKNKTMIKK